MIDATTGIQVKSNINFIFSNSKIKALPTESNSYNVFHIENTQINIFTDAVIEGDRYEHLGEDGEAGHGIYIRGDSNNIVFNNLTVTNCWGDGVFLYRKRKNNIDYIPNKIFFNGTTYISQCRRQGISILAGENLIIERLICEDINGTLPMAGIDIESEHSVDLIGNIYIGYLKTIRCAKCFTMRTRSKITGDINIKTLEHTNPITETWGNYEQYMPAFRVIFEFFDKEMDQWTINVDNIYTEHGSVQLENIYKGCTPRIIIGNLYSKKRTFIRSADSSTTKGLINMIWNQDTDLSNILGNITINNLFFDKVDEINQEEGTNIRPYIIYYSGAKEKNQLEVQDIIINNIQYKNKSDAVTFINPNSNIMFTDTVKIFYFNNNKIERYEKDGSSLTFSTIWNNETIYILPNTNSSQTTSCIFRIPKGFNKIRIIAKKSVKILINTKYNSTSFTEVFLNNNQITETNENFEIGTFDSIDCFVENKNKKLYITTY